MKKSSLKIAVAVPALAVLIVGVIVMVVIVSTVSSNSTATLTDHLLNATVNEYANEFKAISNKGYSMVETLAPVINDTRLSSDNPREDVVNLLDGVLAADQSVVALWTCWEPNAFDGQDAKFVNANEYHDATGYFVPYLFRDGDTINIEPLVGHDDPAAPHKEAIMTGKPSITDPYIYEVGGKSMEMYSIVLPIMQDGRAIGVIGIDISLDEVKGIMNSAGILDDGYLFVLSPGGLFATHRDANLILSDYRSLWLKDYADRLDVISKQGGYITDVAYSDVTNTNMQILASGVMIGDTGRYWTVCGLVPVSTVNASSNQLMWMIIGVGAALIIVTGLVIFLLVHNGLKKMPVITALAGRVAQGDIGNINIQSDTSPTKNEITLLERAFSDISDSIKEQAEVMRKIANGDYSVSVPIRCDGDLMNHAISDMLESTNDALLQITQSSVQVGAGASQIADGSQALAQGATEQAASVEQLSSAISEISVKTKTNAELADKAAVLARTIMNNAEKGSRQMDEMTSAVGEINAASQQISKVIKVIDDIAFQTNILALNAAVEAARAGQHGKGFAVVSEEVRNLASKSAEAAKETGDLIANSAEKAELGSRIAGETAASLAEIVRGINESNQLVSQIAQSSDEQSTGISQINQGINQVAQVVQQNSATAEESAAASEEMSSQSAMLESMIAKFKLKNNERHTIVYNKAMP